MPEIMTRLIPVRVDYVCDKCGEGNMKWDGYELLSMPPRYMHECDKCGCSETSLIKYPRTKYVEEGEL
jgi:uncharacterized Zn finger protein